MSASASAKPNYDVAAYIWPSYHDDPKAQIFWAEGFGEWQSVMSSTPRFEGHLQPKRPLWGYQNEADPRVMEMQIDAAADHGVNVFIYDWYWYDRGPFLEGCLNDGYLKARNHDRVKFYIMWANHDANSVWDKRMAEKGNVVWRADWDRAEFEAIGRRLIERYFGHPSYYRIEGKPVFCIYQLSTFIAGLGSVAAAREALDWLRSEAEKAGLGGLHLQATLRRGMASSLSGVQGDSAGVQEEVITGLGLDSVTHYQWVHVSQPEREYRPWGEKGVAEWEKFAGIEGVDVYPHVSIGWDNNPRFASFRPKLVADRTPEAFGEFLERAKGFVESHDLKAPLITVNSWNEWTEDSYLLPDRDFGYGYLEAVKRVFG